MTTIHHPSLSTCNRSYSCSAYHTALCICCLMDQEPLSRCKPCTGLSPAADAFAAAMHGSAIRIFMRVEAAILHVPRACWPPQHRSTTQMAKYKPPCAAIAAAAVQAINTPAHVDIHVKFSGAKMQQRTRASMQQDKPYQLTGVNC